MSSSRHQVAASNHFHVSTVQTVRRCVYGPSSDDDDDDKRRVDPDLPTTTFTTMVYSPVKVKGQTTQWGANCGPGAITRPVELSSQPSDLEEVLVCHRAAVPASVISMWSSTPCRLWKVLDSSGCSKSEALWKRFKRRLGSFIFH